MTNVLVLGEHNSDGTLEDLLTNRGDSPERQTAVSAWRCGVGHLSNGAQHTTLRPSFGPSSPWKACRDVRDDLRRRAWVVHRIVEPPVRRTARSE